MITKDITIGKIIKHYPEKLEVLMEFGLYCNDCLSAKFESVEKAAAVHGLDVEELIYQLNLSEER
ncbi:hypothetical protein CPAST_c25140 [Clostridium pasteurianum DSM 525 = ATCC 6013]|uniref:DUF1858 domain-containing protein n=1 Tax=Clostridium pasteurianum DSM 525 = ATCC 6013 TaxID=1262449 RepID=A0A0H3J987_CLOPA|nr:DUF1858 domain-containing protein [Clostridium pasteurianum]AJA48583.1 hypothetical protein CPAST_c25140 [Clostridium pasteurianum DSM 525 = ATCC 6013]AJA52571.1 hypothetical protein CLPA_c25140 [Clostridium pasteurianum DSM 525 = ATCC 6013]AOZ75814.1 disulfide oxidoreductase [Clostridium pasteurianum DSM 525 = ATCC 6013]AOZ79610.1 disulfide oxidoreductase [Clostridium pasteurianum]ELP57939.1 hypothetical protein F502_17100 [Clostridium pasteurianum DSM 525 = ATCC 6013]